MTENVYKKKHIVIIRLVMKISGKKLIQKLSGNKFIDEAFIERNARGKKYTSMKSDLKKAQRKLRRDKSYKNLDI